jgi:hypothetical protein
LHLAASQGIEQNYNVLIVLYGQIWSKTCIVSISRQAKQSTGKLL